jgi:hypothetical protein
MAATRVFLISPVRLDGARGRLLREGRSHADVATALRAGGAPIGDVFTYVSGLYFRGKLTYARRFARPPAARWVGAGALVITQNRGLVPAESRITQEHLESFYETPIDEDERNFTAPLERDSAKLREALLPDGQAILLGSLATKKYLVPLSRALGDRLYVPGGLRGRGDMARGAILLRAARDTAELDYQPYDR